MQCKHGPGWRGKRSSSTVPIGIAATADCFTAGGIWPLRVILRFTSPVPCWIYPSDERAEWRGAKLVEPHVLQSCVSGCTCILCRVPDVQPKQPVFLGRSNWILSLDAASSFAENFSFWAPLWWHYMWLELGIKVKSSWGWRTPIGTCVEVVQREVVKSNS